MMVNGNETARNNFDFKDDKFTRHLLDEQFDGHGRILDFLKHLSICHSVTIERSQKQIKSDRPTNRT